MLKNKKIDYQDDFGNGILKEEKTVFVEKGLKGDIVDIEITKEAKKYRQGKINKIIKPSVERQESICPYFSLCGGCDLLHQKYESQLQYKQNKVVNNLKHHLKIDFNYNKIISSNNQIQYRNKIVYHVKNNHIGLYQEKSNDLVLIDKCYLVDDKINDLFCLLQKINLTNVKDITVRYSKFYDQIMLVFSLNGEKDTKEIVDNFKDKVTSIYIQNKQEMINIYGKSFIDYKILDYVFQISMLSFLQVNDDVMISMYEQIKKYISNNKRVLDLYCGIGTIGIFIADKCLEVIGLELVKSSYEDSLINKEINNISNINFINIDCDKINELNIDFDEVVVDPPRAGLDNNTLTYLMEKEPSKIVYTSCNLQTMIRDFKVLVEKYDIQELSMFDMFPNTYHVECVCVLNRR